MQIASRPRMTGSKRTTFRGATRRCKSEWDALPWLRWRRSRRKGQVGAETEERKKRMSKVREDGKESPLCRTIFQYFSVLLTLIFVLSVLLTPAPFVNLSVDTLAKAKRLTHFYSVAPLLEKWFACFPSSGDGLRLAYFPYFPVMQRRLFLFDPFLYFLVCLL